MDCRRKVFIQNLALADGGDMYSVLEGLSGQIRSGISRWINLYRIWHDDLHVHSMHDDYYFLNQSFPARLALQHPIQLSIKI